MNFGKLLSFENVQSSTNLYLFPLVHIYYPYYEKDLKNKEMITIWREKYEPKRGPLG
jgi:hypothetical protein